MLPARTEPLSRLQDVIRSYGPMAIAFSGGVDSGLLAYVAHSVLGGDMICLIAVSPSFAAREEKDAIAFLKEHGIAYETVRPNEIDDPRYRENSSNRCYFCKEALFSAMQHLPVPERFPVLAYGANMDDQSDHRPGSRSASERGVVAPLIDAGFDKTTIRDVSRQLGLRIWDKPAAPCLSSRIPYGTEVTPERLMQIERAEEALKSRGWMNCRVRYSGGVARVEIPLEEHARIKEPGVWECIAGDIRQAGFEKVELVADGLRSGRLNEDL